MNGGGEQAIMQRPMQTEQAAAGQEQCARWFAQARWVAEREPRALEPLVAQIPPEAQQNISMWQAN